MVNERENTLSDRGGVPVKDYTQAGRSLSLSRGQGLSRGSGMEGERSGLQKLNFEKVARGLVWVSLGLGLMEVLIPRRIQQLVGVRLGDYSGLIRTAGIREIMHAFLLLIQGRSHQGVWSRVAGDAMDLGLLGAAFTSPCVEKDRLAKASAFVLGTTALDILTATQLNRQRAEEKQFGELTREDLGGRTRGGAFHVTRSITINSSPETLYQFWRNFQNLPQFMYHLEAVRVMDERRSHWVAKAPAGMRVEWDAEITDDRPNELIAWRSTANADVTNSGQVRFEPAPAGRGTVVRVELEYRPPGGAIGKTIAMLFGEEPGQQVAGDLRRFKQVIETGEVVLSEGSPHGFGQKLQRPAQPMPANKMAGNKMAGIKEERMPRQATERQRDQTTTG